MNLTLSETPKTGSLGWQPIYNPVKMLRLSTTDGLGHEVLALINPLNLHANLSRGLILGLGLLHHLYLANAAYVQVTACRCDNSAKTSCADPNVFMKKIEDLT